MDPSSDEAFLEIDAEPAPPTPDPTPDLPPVADDEAFLEVIDAPAEGARARVLTDDDLQTVTALADDALPLLAALFPARPDLARDLPDAPALAARIDATRRALNQVTRRGPEWRARAEVAAVALTRRLDALPRGDALAPAARAEFVAWLDLQLAARVRAESALDGTLREPELQRLRAWCEARALDPARIDAVAARADVAVHHGESAAWSPLDALPGAPRSLDEAARALTASPAQAVAALREGALSAWLAGHRAPDALVLVAREAEAVCRAHPGIEGAPRVAVWSLAWALGSEGVAVDGLLVTSADTLRAHLRGRRLDGARLRPAADVLSAWFTRQGAHGVASALGRLGADGGSEEAILWSLGDPLRLGDRSASDPQQLAREVLQRNTARAAALQRLHDGSLAAWLDALPTARRDPAWRESIARAGTPEAREAAFWPGIYRRVPRGPLRVALDDRRTARFDTLAELLVPARAAAAWLPLRAAHRSGELAAWLAVAAPGIDLDLRPDAPEDQSLHALLWSLGFTALVLPWGRAGLAVNSPEELCRARAKGPAHLESLLATGLPVAWLRRFHPHVGVAGVDLALATRHFGDDLGAAKGPPGYPSLRLALLCAAVPLPQDPIAPEGEGAAWESLDPSRHDEAPWRALPMLHRSTGVALLWAARAIPAAGLLARRWIDEGLDDDALVRELAALGVPVPSRALEEAHARAQARREAEARRRALEDEAARLAMRREEARVALERETDRLALAREEARRSAEREVARREVAEELSRLAAERDDARAALARELARAEAERAAAEATRARIAAEAELARECSLAAERAARERASRERDEARATAAQTALALAVQVAKQRALEAELAAESARRRVAEARARSESLDAAMEALARTDAERLDALARVREEEARLRALDDARRADLRRARDEAARAQEDQRRALDAAREREEEARAQEAERLAALQHREALATAEARARAEAEAARARHAAEEAERLRVEAEAREAEIARAWTEARQAAEAEITRLAEALREVEARVEALAEPAAEPATEAPAPLAALEGVLEAEGEVAELGDDDASLALDAPRAEYDLDRLAESYRDADEASLDRLRAAVDAWAKRRPAHPWADLATRMSVRAVTMVPAFELHVTTRFETRALTERDGPDAGGVEVPSSATDDTGAVDPWALTLPEGDPWTAWEGAHPLDLPARERPCPDCAERSPRGTVPCARCDGRGTTPCATCEGWGRVSCPRCAGGGEVTTPDGAARCPRCEGRRTIPCAECSLGRVPCGGCEARGVLQCNTCGGAGSRRRGVALRQSVLPVTALAVVAEGLPDAVRDAVKARDAEALPAVHVEAAHVDATEVAREIPHRALAAAAGTLLADERGHATDPRRATRQRLIVRRYPVWRVEASVEGRDHTLWIHGTRGEVYTDDSPLDRWLDDEVAAARDALQREDLASAVDRLAAVMAADLDHAGARAAARSVGEAVRAMALRGELFAAREAATKAAALRWPECLSALAEAERALGRRTAQRASWVVIEEARAALEKDRLERCAERLRELATNDPGSADGGEIAGALGVKVAALARAWIARGELTAAAQRIEAAAAVPFPQCGAALAEVRAELVARRRALMLRRNIPWLVLALAAALAALMLSRR